MERFIASMKHYGDISTLKFKIQYGEIYSDNEELNFNAFSNLKSSMERFIVV